MRTEVVIVRFLGLGIPELVVLLFVIVIPVAVIVIVARTWKGQERKKGQQKRPTESSSSAGAAESSQPQSAGNSVSGLSRGPGVEQGHFQESRFPAGWYRDRENPQLYRWWDGVQWSGDTVWSKVPYDLVPASPGWYKDPMRVGDLRWWDGQRWTEMTDGMPHSVAQSSAVLTDQETEKERYEAQYRRWEQQNQQTERENAAALQAYPAIVDWKTSTGFSILGFLISPLVAGCITVAIFVLINVYLGRAAQAASSSALMNLSGMIGGAVWAILGIGYASFLYSSYYRQKPAIKSQRLMSFLNLLFGGILFGCLWNANLTICKLTGDVRKNAASVVFMVLAVLQVVLTLVYFVLFQMPQLQYVKEYYEGRYAPDLTNAAVAMVGGAEYADEALGLSFTIPEGWQEKELSEERKYVKAKFLPEGEVDVGIVYSVFDLWGEDATPYERELMQRSDFDMDYFAPEDFAGVVEGDLDECSGESCCSISLGGNLYYLYTGSGYVKSSQLPKASYVQESIAVHVVDGWAIMFQLIAPSESAHQEHISDLLAFAASVRYSQ